MSTSIGEGRTAPNDEAEQAAEDEAEAVAVADYLERHPDFFVDRPELFKAMQAPGRFEDDGVVDFQRFQIDRHRSEIDELRNCAQEVIETSRSNLTIQTRTHAAVLAMLNARTFKQLTRIVVDDMPLLLDVDVVAFGFEPTGLALPELSASPDVRMLPEDTVDMTVGADHDAALYRDFMDDGTVFASAAGLVKSAACARLRPGLGLPPGLLALGSRGDTFRPGQGTELLSFLARITELCIRRLLEGRV